MSKGKKIALAVLLVFAGLLLVLAIAVPFLVDINRYRPQVVQRIREETGKPAEIGWLKLSVLPSFSIRVDNFSLGNPSGFPKGEFLKTRRIIAEVDARALLDRRVVIKSLEITEPTLNMLQDARGKWNFENPPKPRQDPKNSSDGAAAFSLGVISKVEVAHARLSAASLLDSGRVGPAFFQGRDVRLRLEEVNLNAFVASAAASLSPRPPEIRAGDESVFEAPLLYAATPQRTPAARGTLEAAALRFGSLEVTSVKSRLRLFAKQIFLDGVNFNLYEGRATANLFFDLAGREPRYAADAKLAEVNVAKLLVAFPEARGKMSGKMDGNMKLSGEVTHSSDPLAGMKGTGQVNVRNGQLPTLQLNKNLMWLARLGSLGSRSGDPSSFSLISADLNIANQLISSKKISIVGNGVDVDGAGSIGLGGQGSLNYAGVASLVSGDAGVSNLLGALSGAAVSGGKLQLPFNIAGTLQNPKFIIKSLANGGQAGALQNMLAGQKSGQQPADQSTDQQQNPLQGLTELFKKKKAQ